MPQLLHLGPQGIFRLAYLRTFLSSSSRIPGLSGALTYGYFVNTAYTLRRTATARDLTIALVLLLFWIHVLDGFTTKTPLSARYWCCCSPEPTFDLFFRHSVHAFVVTFPPLLLVLDDDGVSDISGDFLEVDLEIRWFPE